MTRRLLSVLLLFVAIFLFALTRYSPPAPRGVDTPEDQFSALRARETQRAMSESGQPRDIGSAASESARRWLLAQLQSSGWNTEVQTAMSCTRHGACGRVSNIVATRAGREPPLPAILLMAHYDSVTCSPGASDDGMGTATVMETAAALAGAPPLRRTIVVVLTDGEESGLLGAEAFMRQHPLARTIGGVVNIDARGTRGPSAMFETSPGNAWLIALLARRSERPVTSSLFYEIYRRMPNDTDFTSVKGRAHGVNFANIAGVESYHTPHDTLANADPGTLQHHGDQALAMVRALADAGPELDSPRDASHDAVWFDVLASFIVRWPAAASTGLAMLAFCLVLGWTIRMRAFGLGLLVPLAALAGALAASLLVGGILRYGGALPVPWIAHPLPALISLHGATILGGLSAARLAGRARRATAQVLWAGTWLTWGALGVAVAVIAPGACFLFVVPTFVAGFVAWLEIDLAAALPALAAAVVWMPLVVLVYDGLGLVVPAVACVSSTMLVTTLPALGASRDALGAPLTERRLAIGAAAILIALVGVALFLPVSSAQVPMRANVVFRQDMEKEGAAPAARVYVEAAWGYLPWGRPPEGMVRALGEPSAVRTGAPAPWSASVPYAEVPRVALEPPSVVVIGEQPGPGDRVVRVRLASPRHARTLALVFGTQLVTARVSGEVAVPRNGALVLRGVPAEGVDVELTMQGHIDMTVLDVTSGLPPAEMAPIAHAVHDARGPLTVQTQEGDVTIVARRLDL